MKTKRALLVVESTKKALNRAFGVISKQSRKYEGVTIISFPNYETLGKAITGARIELLNVIREKKPNSIQELARFVKRDFKNVYMDVKFLQEFGLIELEENGARRSSIPHSKFNELLLAA
ncbi:MAG TPA: hypothetical protein VJB34_04380 [Bdellovibrionota bacterium]|nr:hypothetical protein [Bdellovibrionota bacterium]